MIEVEIEFSSPVEWIKSLVESHSAMIKIRDIRKSSEGTRDLVEIFTPGGGIEGLSEELARKMNLEKGHLTLTDDAHATAIVSAHECSICNAISNWDIFLTGAQTDDRGNVVMSWIVPNETTAAGFMDRLERDGIPFTLRRKRNITKKGDITARQEFVVKTALSLGFFDYPKRINLEGLSQKLGVSYVTLAEILRRAEKNIISSYFRKRGE